MRSKIPALTEAMESRWQPHHTVVARRIMAHIDFLDSTIAELSDEIVERLRPFDALVELWTTIPGVSTLTAQTMVAEIGADMARFPTTGAPRLMGRRRTRVPRIGRQTTTRQPTTRKPTPPPGIDRSRQGRITNQRHVPVSPLRPHHPPTRTQRSPSP